MTMLQLMTITVAATMATPFSIHIVVSPPLPRAMRASCAVQQAIRITPHTMLMIPRIMREDLPSVLRCRWDSRHEPAFVHSKHDRDDGDRRGGASVFAKGNEESHHRDD